MLAKRPWSAGRNVATGRRCTHDRPIRPGETEAMGFIEKVSYEIAGNQVLVKYESGPMRGTAVRYTVTEPNEVRSQVGVLRRIN